ncbi:porin [Aestuariivirga sp.]|uniref:porin n=1 Tax=Aestuariivirga sp. TaxID=2650926 RepID=UPI0039E3DDB2
MKVMKLALLGTAALAAVSVSARADDLSALKAQIEALQADVAALQAAPAVPAGFSLMTVSEGDRIVVPGLEVRDNNMYAKKVTTIGVLPTADVPASTVIQWSGSVRAALAYYDRNYYTDDYEANTLHIKARGRLDVTGTTDTAVGEVGASMSIYADIDNTQTSTTNTGFTSQSGTVKMDYAWGWWKMTPELTFAGGYNGSLATIGYGIRKINDAYISRGSVGVDGGDFTQLRLSYNSGPIGIAVALEHTDEGGNYDDLAGTPIADIKGGPLGVAAEVTYSGDMFNAELAGFVRDTGLYDEKYTQSQIGLGLGAKLSDMFDVSVAGSVGNNVFYTISPSTINVGDGWEVSAAIVATLSDSISAEVGAGYSKYKGEYYDDTTKTTAVAGGIYWSPVSQLKTGLQASYTHRDTTYDYNSTETRAAWVTWWNF